MQISDASLGCVHVEDVDICSHVVLNCACDNVGAVCQRGTVVLAHCLAQRKDDVIVKPVPCLDPDLVVNPSCHGGAYRVKKYALLSTDLRLWNIGDGELILDFHHTINLRLDVVNSSKRDSQEGVVISNSHWNNACFDVVAVDCLIVQVVET